MPSQLPACSQQAEQHGPSSAQKGKKEVGLVLKAETFPSSKTKRELKSHIKHCFTGTWIQGQQCCRLSKGGQVAGMWVGFWLRKN